MIVLMIVGVYQKFNNDNTNKCDDNCPSGYYYDLVNYKCY